ncbi:MAG: hypothetical protein KTR23_02100 [Rhodospirillales bacterium]|nr:hypothetical protein [Rhodospirillales bacterium]
MANAVKSGTLNIAIAMPFRHLRGFLSFLEVKQRYCSARAWTKCPTFGAPKIGKWTKCPLAFAIFLLKKKQPPLRAQHSFMMQLTARSTAGFAKESWLYFKFLCLKQVRLTAVGTRPHSAPFYAQTVTA